MRPRAFILVLGLLLALVPAAAAHEHDYFAILTGANEAPPNGSPGFGFATVHWDLDLVTMHVDVTFSGLVGTVTAAHIHAPTLDPFTGTAGVATPVPTFPGFPSGVTSGFYSQTFDMTLASSYNPAFITSSGGLVSDALNALFNATDSGRAYLNIHTTAFGGGEIRGFLQAVPEPSTFVLGGLGVAGVGATLRRAKRQRSLRAR